MHTESARVHLDEGMAEGSQPVEGHGSIGTIRAEGFRVLDRGARIFFLGRSKMVFEPESQKVVQ